MPYPKSAEQATFEWMPPLPFYSLGQSKNMCTRILLTQLQLKQDVVENKLIKRENLWIKPYICLIKLKSHFGSTQFDDKFPTFGVASCIMVPDNASLCFPCATQKGVRVMYYTNVTIQWRVWHNMYFLLVCYSTWKHFAAVTSYWVLTVWYSIQGVYW